METRKEGLRVYYSLSMPCANVFLNCVDRIIEERYEEKGKALKNMQVAVARPEG
ncbi:MAG: hypothetical protein ACOX42_02945 [Clostridia bacterium]